MQVRLIPVSIELTEKALKLCQEINKKEVRADVDDRDETLAKKVREAETSWISYIVVIGKRELRRNVFPVRVRGEENPRNLTIEKLMKEVKSKVKGYPYRPLTFPIRLSVRPSF